jgi:hypothetical protein
MNAATLSSLTLAGLLASTGVFAATPGDATDEDREIRASEGFVKDHAADELRDPRERVQIVTPATNVATKPRADVRGPKIAAAQFGDAYVYEASTDLFSDADLDGYFHYLRVIFDADTIRDAERLYAIIYVSADGKAWERVFTTADFTVTGASPDDDYEVETDLVTGYSTGLYDVLIELYDADENVLVDEFGPNESSDFSVLPLEDSVRDGNEPPPPPADDGGGGATSWLALPALLAALLAERRRRRAVAAA